MISRLTEILLLGLFCLPAVSPLLTAVPTRSADGLLHLYRLVELDALWHSGVFWTRWLPDLAYGYGMPLFNYYAPLVYYLTTPLHVAGMPFTLALNVSLAISLVAAATGMFYFARALVSKLGISERRASCAALVAALAYVYAPYLLFNTFDRANLAEQWALAFAPAALGTLFRLSEQATVRRWVWAVLFFAAVMLAHNVTSFLFAPLWCLLALVCLVAHPERLRRPATYFVPLSALVVALALSSFFWLPALLERDFVQIARVIVTPDFDYRFNFVSPLELTALVPRVNTGQMNPAFPSTLGVVPVFLTLVGAGVLARSFRDRRAFFLWALVFAGIAYVGLMLAVSQPVWDNVSLLAFVQLPMRLRGLVALVLAPVIGVSVLLLPVRYTWIGTGIAIVALVLGSWSLLYPRYARDVPLNPTLSDMFAYEQATGALGTTSFGEYLPAWVQIPPDKSPFAGAYAERRMPDRFVIPEGVVSCGTEIMPDAQTLCATFADSWRAVFQTFFFPGWTATLDGRPLEITPTLRTGLVTFEVPASGTVQIAYTGTPIENFSNGLALGALLLTVGVSAYAGFRSARQSKPVLADAVAQPAPAGWGRGARTPAVLIALALILIAFKFLYTDRVSNPFVVVYDGSVPAHMEEHPFAPLAFGGELELLNFDPDETRSLCCAGDILRVQPGETLTVTLYWRALVPQQSDLSTFAHIATREGVVVAQKDNLHPANLPTTRWELDSFVADAHPIAIPSNLAPGDYELRVGVYDPRTNTRLAPAPCCDNDLLAIIRVEQK